MKNLRIENGWLVEEVDEHTCGDGVLGRHEPHCGMIPLVQLDTLPGWVQTPPPSAPAAPVSDDPAPEAPGQPGRGEKGSGGRVEALARVLRSVGVEIGYAGADTYRTVVAERILADPGPLLAALAEAGVLRDREWPAPPTNPHRTEETR